MKNKVLKVWGKGPLIINGIEIDCYVLDDGTPILNKGKMMKLLKRSWKGQSRTSKPVFIGAINLQRFIRPELEEKLNGIKFYDGRREIIGYHADILAEMGVEL